MAQGSRWPRTAAYAATIYVRTTPELHRAAAELARSRGETVCHWALSVVADRLSLPRPALTPHRVDSPSYSGVIFLRTSQEMHARVKEEAAKEGLFMAHWVEGLLAQELAVQPRAAQVRIRRTKTES
jgi:predicted HicB family RNase H-like nuclease